MEMKSGPYTVYVQTDSNGYITAVHSSEFLPDTAQWDAIDSGYGDRYHHAQGNYFPQPICIQNGVYRYKLVDGKTAECTAEEIAEQENNSHTNESPFPTLENRVALLEAENSDMKEALEMILSGVTE